MTLSVLHSEVAGALVSRVGAVMSEHCPEEGSVCNSHKHAVTELFGCSGKKLEPIILHLLRALIAVIICHPLEGR